MSTQTTFKAVYRPVTKVIDETLSSSVLDFTGRVTNFDFIADQTEVFSSLANKQHFIDGQIVVISNRSSASIHIASNLIISNKAIEIKPNTASIFVYLFSRSKFFDITSSAQIDEIQQILDSINSDVLALQSSLLIQNDEINELKTKVDALQLEENDGLFVKEKIIIDSETKLSYIDLQHKAVPNSIVASIDRLLINLNEDFVASTVNGITRLTWIGPLVYPDGDEKIELNDAVFLNYKISNSVLNSSQPN